MKRKSIIAFILLIVGMIVVLIIFQLKDKNVNTEEDSLIFQGDGKKEISVDIAIQSDGSLLYIGNVICMDSQPTLMDVLNTINENDQGVFISIGDDDVIEKINDIENKEMWKIEIDNKEIDEVNVKKIFLETNQGITIRN